MNDVLLTAEQAQQIEEAFLNALNGTVDLKTYYAHEAIRAARAQEQAEQEPPVDSLMVDVSALLGPFVEDGKPIRVKDARDILRRVRKRRFTAEPAPVRTKDLADDEVAKAYMECTGGDIIARCRAVIAKFKEKNK